MMMIMMMMTITRILPYCFHPTLELLVAQLEQHEHILEDLLTDLRYDEKLQNLRISRTPEKDRVNRKTFTVITDSLTGTQFRRMIRMFRMPRKTFVKLCTQVGESVDDDVFKSENKTRSQKKTDNAATKFRGGEISGEVRMAAYLRIMSGASYLDVFMIYDMKTKQIYNSFEKCLGWVNDTFTLPLVKVLHKTWMLKNLRSFQKLSLKLRMVFIRGALVLLMGWFLKSSGLLSQRLCLTLEYTIVEKDSLH
jgi:hypothetical protein